METPEERLKRQKRESAKRVRRRNKMAEWAQRKGALPTEIDEILAGKYDTRMRETRSPEGLRQYWASLPAFGAERATPYKRRRTLADMRLQHAPVQTIIRVLRAQTRHGDTVAQAELESVLAERTAGKQRILDILAGRTVYA